MPNKFTMCVYIPSAVCHLLHMTDSHESSLYIHWWCIRQLYVHDARQKKNAHGDLLSNSPWFRKQKLLLLGHVSNIRLFVYEIGTCSVTKQPVSVRVKTVLLKVRNMVAMHANRVIPVSSEYNTWRWWIGQRLSFSNWSGEKKTSNENMLGLFFFVNIVNNWEGYLRSTRLTQLTSCGCWKEEPLWHERFTWPSIAG